MRKPYLLIVLLGLAGAFQSAGGQDGRLKPAGIFGDHMEKANHPRIRSCDVPQVLASSFRTDDWPASE